MSPQIIELVISIKDKKAMYLTHYSVFTLKSFIDGWLLGQINASNDDDQVMHNFQQFIVTKYEQSPVMSWDRILNLYSNSEEAALNLFFKEFEAFCNEQGIQPQKPPV